MIFQVSVAFTVLVNISAEQCTTPNNEIAECKSLYSCPTIIKAIAAQDPMSTEFVRLSSCGGNASNPLVCCGSSSNFMLPRKPVPEEPVNPSNSSNLFPNKKICGYQHSDDYFRPYPMDTGINEFPWLALLLYKDAQGNFKQNIRCGGSLINTRYILTAANCIEEVRHQHYYIEGIRLGEWDVKSRVDCEDEFGIEECSNPFEGFEIEETVIHPNYTSSPNILNDIALIRLNRTVTYSDYIRPICLPLPGTVVAQVGDTLQSSGWGLGPTANLVNIKKKIESTLIANEECIRVYHDKGVQLNITKNQFCTEMSEYTASACIGDSGGPMMSSHRLQWYQEGINSFAASPCRSLPYIHTKVRNYIDWIQENAKP